MGGKKTVESFEGECPPGHSMNYYEDGTSMCIKDPGLDPCDGNQVYIDGVCVDNK